METLRERRSHVDVMEREQRGHVVGHDAEKLPRAAHLDELAILDVAAQGIPPAVVLTVPDAPVGVFLAQPPQRILGPR